MSILKTDSEKQTERLKEKFFQLVEKYKDCLVIVEGKKDEESLKKIGFKKIKTLKKSLYEVAEEIEEDKVIILTDFDRTGREIYKKLNPALRQQGIFVDNTLRRFISRHFRIAHIEGLKKILS
jgi:5S rRNA maturation endonuclease (ribonuclease M5)